MGATYVSARLSKSDVTFAQREQYLTIELSNWELYDMI